MPLDLIIKKEWMRFVGCDDHGNRLEVTVVMKKKETKGKKVK